MKKVSFSVFALLFCLLFINTQPQFAAGFSEGKVKTLAKKGTGEKKPLRTNVKKQTALWQQVSEDLLKSETHGLPDPEKYLVFRLNKTALTELLADVPSELKKVLPEKSVIMELPMPDGSFARFRIEESSVLEPDLAARFPEIKSYRGQGIDDPTLTTRFDWTPQGFHAMILSGGGQPINIEPANVGDSSLYISYYGDDLKKGEYACLVKDFQKIETGLPQTDAPQTAVGSTLRNFRIAIATNYEYTTNYGGGTVSGTVATLNTWLNGANLIYERDLSIHLNLVNNTSIIYTTANDPYDNNDVVSMLYAASSDINSKVGQANYDIGHVMGYLGGGASGVAYVGVVCNSGFKGGAATLMGGSAGNSSTLGVWVHELGHQFGADHNFNGTQGNCGPSRSNTSTYESGSGSTIMGYPQICGSDNILYSRDMRFHAMSYAAINNYIASSGSCFIGSATGNTSPTVSGGGNWTIPKNTPFTLTATASDPNGDSLTYNWEQIDAGGANYPQNGTSASYNDAGDSSTTTRPIFRPYQSVSSPSRDFPNLFYIRNFANDPPDTDSYGQQTADELPRIARTLNFRVTVRDNRADGGGVNEDTVRVTVDNSGPFLVTSPNTNINLTGGTAQNVTWSVNNTNAAPVNAANVKISLSTDGGLTFPTVLAANTPNDGSQSVTIPNITTTTARIKVEAVGNIFFDISNTNFSITAGGDGTQSYEADVITRPSGNGIIDADDIEEIRRLAVGLDMPYQSNEFQRADCSPRSTRGDGVVDADDIEQARRYAVGLDTKQTAGGPTGPSQSRAQVPNKQFYPLIGKTAAPEVGRAVRVVSQMGNPGQAVTVPINVDTEGDEAGYTFSISFDQTKLTANSVVIGDLGGNVTPNINNANGTIGLSVTSFPGGTIARVTNQTLVRINFTVAADAAAGTTPLNFTDNPASRRVSGTDPNNPLPQPTYENGNINIASPTAADVSVGGRLDNGKGRGVANAQIIMTNSRGETRIARSNAFGYFRFADVPAGETYIFTVKSKQYRFSAQVVNVIQDLTDLILTAQSRQ